MNRSSLRPSANPARSALEHKRARLRRILRGTGGLLVAFSGGTDSAFLLAAAREALGDRVLAVTAVSPLFPAAERRAAAALARRLGARHLEIRFDALSLPRVAANPPDRCYYCKRALFRRLARLAARAGLPAVADGTQADDRRDERPGARAAAEAGVLHPLLAAGFRKADIRAASRALGLPTADAPAQACLASRIPYGTPITLAGLRAVARLEALLHRLGCRQARVRHHGAVARIEVEPRAIPRLARPDARRALAALARRAGFVYAALDLQGYRTGSLNEAAPRRAAARRAARPVSRTSSS